MPATFQTYTDPITGLSPSELNVALALSISQADIEGSYIELPYDGFMPSLGDSVYANFEMSDDIFSLVTPSAPALDSIVESFEDDAVNHKLIIKLKKTVTTVETLNLKFQYNMDYDAKIPSGQIIWNDVKAVVKGNDDSIMYTSNVLDVKAQTFSGDLSVNLTSQNTNITSNVATAAMGFYNQARKKALLDTSYNNYYYIDIPTGFDFSPKGFFGDASKVEVENISGYTRYKVEFTDSAASFPTNWNASVGGTYGLSPTLSGFNSLNMNETAEFRIGITFKKINDVVKTNEKTLTFTKTDLSEWGIKVSLNHSTGSTFQSIVESATPNSLGRMVTIGGSAYEATTRNIAQNEIKDFNITLVQKESDSQKASFSSITIRNAVESASITPTQYKVKYEIKNGVTSATREEETGLYTGTQSLTLPTLAASEYINKIILIPMGVSGTDEGSLPSKNGLAISYLTKNWDTLYWPDGTKIAQNKTYKVTMGATTNYLDESDSLNPELKQVESQDCIHYYTPTTAVDAYAYIVSSNSTSKVPGNIVNYELQGYTGKNSIAAEWKAPEMVVAIPKVLELQNTTFKADYVDAVNNQTHTNAVNITLLNADTTYNYYRFSTSKNALKIDGSVSFRIPLKFKVADGTKQGTYNIPTVTVSGDNFVQVSRDMNNLSNPSKYDYDNSISRYTAINTGHTPTTIASLTKLNGGTASRAMSTDSWTTSTYFGVKKNTNPQMKSEIKNVGNTTFTNVRAYNILPYNGDARGSSGNVSFTGLNGAGTVYYTAKPVASLPSYDGLDLQTWNTSTLTANGFSTTVPTDLTTVTAIYINYGNLEVNPLDSLETILNFKIPNADDQIAVNQFVYSAKEKGTTTQLNAKSDAVTFSTEIGQIIFHENTPATTTGSVANMPNPISQTVVLDTLKKGIIQLSSTVPTLTGYTFEHWKDEPNSKTYNPNDIINFDKNINSNTLLNLNAKWTANSYEIAFDKNEGSGSMENQDMTYDTSATLERNVYTRPGYRFIEWNTKANGTGTRYTDEASVNNLIDSGVFTLFAQWEANTHTVEFDKNTGTGTMSNQSFVYDEEQILAANSFTKLGYKFVGWNTKANGTGTNYTNKENVKNLAIDGTITLYAKWEANTYTIAFDNNTGTGNMDDQSFTYDTAKTLNANTFVKDGYTFTGWNTKANGTGTNYANTENVKNLLTGGAMTLYAKWEANTYTVAFDNNTGTGSMNAESFTYDVEKALNVNTFIKDGYTFIGWNTKANGTGTNYTNNASVKNLATTGTITLYAKWEANTYTVAFENNTGTGSMASQSFTYDATQELKINTFEKDGHTFVGWNTKADGTGTNYANKASVKNLVATGTITLYAKWEANTYNVSYELDGGINHPDNPLDYTYGIEVVLNEPSKEGHSFLGWEDTIGNSITKIFDTDLGDKSFVAKWGVNTYNIDYELDGGINHPDNPTNYTYGVGIELKDPTKDGYIFLGWSMDTIVGLRTFELFSKPSESLITSISIADLGNKKLTAQWEKEKDEVITLIPVVDPDGSSVVEKEVQTKDATSIITYSVLFTTTLSALGFISFKKRNKIK